MRTKLFTILILIVAVVVCPACSGQKAAPGTSGNPIHFYFMPFKGEASFELGANAIEKFVESSTGLAVESVYAPDFITIVKEFGKKKADIAFLNTLGYLLARDWANAEAHLRYIYGDIYTSYRGEILARTDGKIERLEDLAGKAVAFADPYSASGYLYPLKLLLEHNARPAKTIFTDGHLKAVEMLYDGQVDAAATYHERPSPTGLERDARAELISKYPDVIAKLKIVVLTEEIPNGPVTLRHDLPQDIKAKLVGALLEFARTEEGRKALLGLYNVTGLTMATDADYDGVRSAVKECGKTIQDLVPGGEAYYRTYIEPGLE